MEEFVILVDENDRETGTMEKMQAHLEAHLHRAFSVFIFNQAGQLMLQQRAFTKYHTPGLWTNTCCSHPRPGEITIDAAHRRLRRKWASIAVSVRRSALFTRQHLTTTLPSMNSTMFLSALQMSRLSLTRKKLLHGDMQPCRKSETKCNINPKSLPSGSGLPSTG